MSPLKASNSSVLEQYETNCLHSLFYGRLAMDQFQEITKSELGDTQSVLYDLWSIQGVLEPSFSGDSSSSFDFSVSGVSPDSPEVLGDLKNTSPPVIFGTVLVSV